ncbi:acyl--CoA ligase [Enemella dayhoffiae]|uniref:Acyl--CoA ligase n=1 Tax=Enemella dayhoffiae TaxID=2016507 RepID=A0A255GL82_9ACTN|nr:class I adenylate-forming enzyme family protein [Enemella dayhoffiae]OYO16570.1 acyl--CoA ligase [Enemella dayhoffiae]
MVEDPLADLPVVDPATAAEYHRAGWWGDRSLPELVADRARSIPEETAVAGDGIRWTWADLDRQTDAMTVRLAGLGLPAGARVAVLLPDGPTVHAALLGCARAGLVAVGIGARSGDAEIAHLARHTRARALLTQTSHRGRRAEELLSALTERGVPALPLLLADQVTPSDTVSTTTNPPRGVDEVSILNSTSGTTGLPKCVTQFDNRWLHFCDLAIAAGRLNSQDRVLAAVPTPYGFGLWTSHYLGPRLGVPTHRMARFDATEALRLIERERITVLACVTTQFRMMLASPELAAVDLSSLRVMFTGGEAIPFERAREFEERTGSALLQFFGSNETGALAYSSVDDPPEVRLRTGGRLIPHMRPRLYDPDTGEQTTEQGQPGCRGPLTSLGYFADQAANSELFTRDGWMLMGDLVEFAPAPGGADTLRLIGRTSDIIIRGGKNISAAEVEAKVETHPEVVLAAVVPVPDDVFGERVCAVLTTTGRELGVDDVAAHLTRRGVSREWFPERVLVVAELPRNAGGKIAKGEVRRIAREFFAEQQSPAAADPR